VKKLVYLRKQFTALRRGSIRRLCKEIRHDICAFARLHEEGNIVVTMNTSPNTQRLNIFVNEIGWQDGYLPQNILGIGEVSPVKNGHIEITLAPWSGSWLK
jgi:hypothetical protein